MPKLTKRLIDSLVVEKTSYFIWDSEVIGFGIRVMPSGVRTYQVQYRKGRRTRRSSIGRHGVVTLDQARRTAKAMLGLVASGQDPIEEIARERMAPTVNELCDRFLEMHVADRCKPSTARDYKSVIRRFVKPIIGTYRVAEVERKDIADLHYKLKATPIQANRTLSVLSKMFNMAEIWGLRDDGSNPCRRVPKYRENRKERFLSTDELSKIGHVLSTALTDGSETPYVVAAFRLLLLTGCRLSEIQKMKWEYTTERGLELPETKTGKRCIPLPHSAREVLSDIPKGQTISSLAIPFGIKDLT